MEWDKVNRIGRGIEAALAAVTILVVLALGLEAAFLTEWRALPDTLRTEAGCLELISIETRYGIAARPEDNPSSPRNAVTNECAQFFAHSTQAGSAGGEPGPSPDDSRTRHG